MSSATEMLALILQPPLNLVPGLRIPLDEQLKESFDAEWQATISIADLFTERPSWLYKILEVWKKLDKERLPKVREYVSLAISVVFVMLICNLVISMLSKVRSDWYGNEPDPDTMMNIYSARGDLYPLSACLEMLMRLTRAHTHRHSNHRHNIDLRS